MIRTPAPRPPARSGTAATARARPAPGLRRLGLIAWDRSDKHLDRCSPCGGARTRPRSRAIACCARSTPPTPPGRWRAQNGAHCILRVADELPGGETRGGRRASSRRLKTRAALEHPNLLRVLGGGDTERGPYTLLELPAARPLSAVIAEDGPLDPLRTVRLLQGVAEALDLANEQGLIHLELSPQNILVENREDGRALLMDFGISPEVSRVRVGLTPDYRSPDELRHLPPEQASNVYSLACIAWACLTGHPPFVRQSPVAVSYAHTSDPPPVLTAERPDLPAHVDKVMEAALAKEPGDRYRSSGGLHARAGRSGRGAERPRGVPGRAPAGRTRPRQVAERPRGGSQGQRAPHAVAAHVGTAVPAAAGA